MTRMVFQSIALFALLTGCASLHDGSTVFGPQVREINRKPPADARQYVVDSTVRTYDPGTPVCFPVSAGQYTVMSCSPGPSHGTQIEYYAPSGRAYLWYPGNSRPVPSVWKLDRDGDRYRMCSRYPSRSYNPVTGEHGGRWRCEDLASYAGRIRELRKGDIFSLATGRVPHVLEKADTTFDSLLARGK